ncbi:MAG: endolytic transglycosylase MltG [Oscillospiraceae bacterium]|nr:endolytic transglycosylase MltG [Oscillospiraceae bacterium]
MDKNNKDWFEPSESELGPDEEAIYSARLTHPDDLELEKILAEDWSGEEDGTRRFQVPEEEIKDEPQQETPAEEESDEILPEVLKKLRPKSKKGYGLFGLPHIASTLIWIAIIAFVGVSLGRLLWVWCADIMAFGKPNQVVTITITDEDTIGTISNKLADAELIRYPNLFKTFATLTDKDERIDPGTYTLNSQLDYNAMINKMSTSSVARDVVEIMFPEGYNCRQMFELLEEKGVCSVKDLEDYAADGELSEYWFLEGVARGDKYCLEGYLFPDTYKFYTNDSPRRVLEKFLDGFDYRFTDKMKTDFETMKTRYAKMMASHGYSQDYINQHALTMKDVVIIASLIEKETSGGEESFDISSVIYNRLTNQSENPYLNIDAALVYALGGKKELTEEDKQYDSPYNTYKYPGLIPGPISNPGRESLYAALDPNDTKYLYYALNPATGKHHFTKSYREHLNFLNSLG